VNDSGIEISLLETLRTVEAQGSDEIGVFLAYFCLSVLSVILTAWAVTKFVRTFTPILGWVKRHKIDALFVVPFVLFFVYIGSTKNGHVIFPYTELERRYLFDTGSYCTNSPTEYVHVSFTKLAIVPDTANLLGYVRPAGSTNESEWIECFSNTFENITVPFDMAWIGAQTNDFAFFTDWTPGPPIQTNGVALIYWQGKTGTVARCAMPYTGLYVNGERLAPDPAITNNTEMIQ